MISPVYGCVGCLKELHRAVMASLEPIADEIELVLVNDASPDGSWERIQALAESDRRVVGINLSRNFGQHAAITAGLDHCTGDYAVVLDCDLQDRPEAIPTLLAKAIDEDYDVVFAARANRKDNWFRRTASRSYAAVFRFLTDIDHDTRIANFSVINRRVIDAIKQLRERDRAYSLLVRWVGFRTAVVPVEHSKRFEGRSSYTLGRMIRFAFHTFVAHSNKPLLLSVQVGLAMASLSILYGLYLVLRYIFYTKPPSGWTSLIVTQFFLGGLILAQIGIVGYYVGRTFDESRRRPLYLVRQTLNLVARPESPGDPRGAVEGDVLAPDTGSR